MKTDDDKLDPKGPDPEEKFEELNNKYLRALADYQNLTKQTGTWKQEFIAYATGSLIIKLLEVLDDLEKAQEEIKNDGLSLVVDKFKKTLETEGLEALQLEGTVYDPKLAEAVSMEPGDKPDTIIKVLQKGYKLGDRIIRPAKVVVSILQK